jgi:hypothetical protein
MSGENISMKSNLKVSIICFLIIILMIGGCEKNMVHTELDLKAKLEAISDEDLAVLAEKKIFFGHKSVGENIMEGIMLIQKDNPRFSKIKVIGLREARDIPNPGIYHGMIGKNGFADTKFSAFKNFLNDNRFKGKFDIAAMKLCYIDIMEQNDETDIFNQYQKCISEVQNSNPSLELVHITTPLTVHSMGIRSWIKTIIKGDKSNYKRSRYNGMLKSYYKDNGFIYDLAFVESTYPNGNRESFTYGGEEAYSLIHEYTSDGGHLNDLGKKIAALEFVRLLINASK